MGVQAYQKPIIFLAKGTKDYGDKFDAIFRKNKSMKTEDKTESSEVAPVVTVKKHRGRPKGSKNKPKPEVAPQSVAEIPVVELPTADVVVGDSSVGTIPATSETPSAENTDPIAWDTLGGEAAQ